MICSKTSRIKLISLALLLSAWTSFAGETYDGTVRAGAQIVKRMEGYFEAFFPTAGFQSWEQFEEDLRRVDALSEIRRTFDSDKIELAVYTNSEVRDSI